MNNNITHRQVMDRARNRIEPPPMATYCEPSQRAIISARDQQAGQRIERNSAEAMALLRRLEKEPVPELEELEDPVFNAEFIAGLIAGLIAGVSFSVIVAGALILGDRL